jgi:uncharacterized protein (TIGR02147 family)
MGCSPAFFNRVVNGTRNLSPEHVIKLGAVLGLGRKEQRYFEILVNFNQAKRQMEKDHYFAQIESYQSTFVKEVSAKQYGMYSRWYYMVLRELLHIMPVKADTLDAYKRIGQYFDPPVKAAEVKEALDALVSAGAIEKTKAGYQLVDNFIRSGANVPPVILNRVFLEFLDLSRRAIDQFSREERSMSSLTFSVSPEGYRKVKDLVAQCRKDALAAVHADQGDADRVYHLDFNLFPVSRSTK